MPIPDSDGDEINDEGDKCRRKRTSKQWLPEEINNEIKKVDYSAKQIQFIVNNASLTKVHLFLITSQHFESNPGINVSIEDIQAMTEVQQI
jgi:hypothetical protein